MAGRLTPERAAYGFAALAGLIVLWNAVAYPSGAGYDAASHKEYANFLIEHHRLPIRNETPEYYSPPLYYGIAGALASLGRHLGLGDPFKLVQLLNVPIAVGTVLLVIALARLLWPDRRWLPVYAAGFVALNPVLARVGSMVNPEPTDLFITMACLYLAARILLDRGSRIRDTVLLGVALGCGEMVRQFALWTLAVVVLAFVAARRREILLALVVCAVIALPWYVYRAQNYGNAVFDRPQSTKPLWERRPASFYLSPGLPDVFARPYRPHLVNRVWPQTYSDLWGDWYGVFAWSSAHERPSPEKNGWLVVQNVLGLLPTGLALGGWLVLLWRSLRRLDPPRLLVALLPLAGIAGFLYFTVSFPTPDGDVIKPMYMLTTLGAWALCFAWVAERLPRLRWALVAIAALDLLFIVYKGGVGLF